MVCGGRRGSIVYSLARGKAVAVTRESGEVAAYSCTWAVPRQERAQPAQPRYHARGARPEGHVITNFIQHLAPEGIIIIHKICITLYTLYCYKVR